MSWRPNTPIVHNSFLDAFRETAAVILEGSTPITYLVFEVHAHWTILGGRLWWRRWSEGIEMVYGFEIPTNDNSEHFDDWVIDPQESPLFLRDLLDGRYTIRNYDNGDETTGRIVSERKLRWLTNDEANKARKMAGFLY